MAERGSETLTTHVVRGVFSPPFQDSEPFCSVKIGAKPTIAPRFESDYHIEDADCECAARIPQRSRLLLSCRSVADSLEKCERQNDIAAAPVAGKEATGRASESDFRERPRIARNVCQVW